MDTRKLVVRLPRHGAAAVIEAAERYGKTADTYMGGAILRQLLDDRAIGLRALALITDDGIRK